MSSAGDNRLPTLAAGIRRAHADAQSAARMVLARAIEAGEHLLEAKELVKHGEWLPWLREHCPEMSERTAQVYMRLARNKDAIDTKSAAAADLTIVGAIEELTRPKDKAGFMRLIAEYGWTEDDLNAWRSLRDAELASPGIVRRCLDDILASGAEPTREALMDSLTAAISRKKK